MRAIISIVQDSADIFGRVYTFYKLHVTADGKDQRFGFYASIHEAVIAASAARNAYELLGMEVADIELES